MNDQTFAQNQDGSIALRERPADAGAPVLVFLHGSGFSSAVFDAQFASPRLAGYRLIGIDLPGHGRSRVPENASATYSFGGLAREVSGVLASLNHPRVILVGWSLGGHVALEMLDTDPHVAGALIMSAPPLPAGPIGPLRGLHFSRDMLLGSKARFSTGEAMRFERLCLGAWARGDHVAELEALDPQARPLLARAVFLGQNRDQRQLALDAAKPLCIVQGVDDPIVRASYVAGLVSTPEFTGESHLLPAVGHAPFVQSRRAFESILDVFAQRVLTGESQPATSVAA